MRSEEIVAARNLKFSYDSHPVFDGVDLSITSGSFVVLMGANGTGKSTLLQLLLGELAPLSGSIRLFGKDIRKFHDWWHIGYVAQNGLAEKANFPATALEVVQASVYSRIGLSRYLNHTLRDEALLALEKVGMREHARILIGNMSGGQRQRVLLASALVNDPSLMVLDEPVSGVDNENSLLFYEIISHLNQVDGLTVLMVSHDVRRVEHYASHIYNLTSGRLVAVDTAPAQVRDVDDVGD